MNKDMGYEEQEYIAIDKSFKDQLNQLSGLTFESEEERREKLRSIGQWCDERFRYKTGIEITEFVEKHPSYFTFSEKIEYLITGKKTKKKKSTSLTKEKKSSIEQMMARLGAGDLPAEMGMGFSLLRAAQESMPMTMSHKAFWIGDCLAKEAYEEYGFRVSEEEREVFYMDYKTLKRFEQELADLRKADPEKWLEQVLKLNLTDVGIRDMLGLNSKQFGNPEIFSTVSEFCNESGKRWSKKTPVPDDPDRWIRFFEFESFCRVKGLETGKYSARNQHPEHAYRFFFDTAASIDFFNFIMLGLFTILPKGFYRLMPGAQLIYRAICSASGAVCQVVLDELCVIAKIEDKNVTTKRRTTEGYLEQLWTVGLIQKPKNGRWATYEQRGERYLKRTFWYDLRKTDKLPKRLLISKKS